MNAIKFLVSVGLALILGCGGTPTTGDIVGTWDLIAIRSQVGTAVYEVPSEEIEEDPLSYVFNEDQAGTEIYQGEEVSVEWELAGDTLAITAYGTTLTYTCSVTRTRLIRSFPQGEFTITQTFARR